MKVMESQLSKLNWWSDYMACKEGFTTWQSAKQLEFCWLQHLSKMCNMKHQFTPGGIPFVPPQYCALCEIVIIAAKWSAFSSSHGHWVRIENNRLT